MRTTVDAIVAEVLRALEERTAPRRVRVAPETDLLDCPGLDSLDVLRLVSDLESTYSITLDLEDLIGEGAFSPARIAALVHARTAASEAAREPHP